MAFMMEWIRPDEKVLTAAEVKKLPVGTKVTIIGADRRGECTRQECTVAQSYKTKVLRWMSFFEATRRQLEKEQITGKLIHLCFTCDPYPDGYDTTTTREIIKVLKEYGNHVQILTKGDGTRDFDLLDGNDWYGITLDGGSRKVTSVENFGLSHLTKARERGIKTWISFEPVLNARSCLITLQFSKVWADKVKIGKLNYHASDIDWKKFGNEAEAICKEKGIEYYIKDSLRAEMERP